MNLLDALKDINPEINEFVQQDIVNLMGETIGSRCYGINSNGEAFSGGTAENKDTALRIAIAEAFERSFFCKILENDNLRQSFGLIEYPSTSGFAFGFDNKKTRFRAICEGLERWAWSKWIDEHFKISEDSCQKNYSKLTNCLLNDFSNWKWFRKDFEVEINTNEKIKLTLAIFLGLTDNGIFPGSRVSTNVDDLYEHPVIEAHRNLTNFLLNNNNEAPSKDIIVKRTIFFGNNKKVALDQIALATNEHWPLPELLLLNNYETNIPGTFLYRCLFNNFIGWHAGEEERFVY